MPTPLIKASAPLGRFVGPMMGFPPNLRELIRSSDGVTYYAHDDKAREQLGYTSRAAGRRPARDHRLVLASRQGSRGCAPWPR